ncbi:hypothetical protein TrCOL_g3482 [Triparma columacea]|uniref:Uncharacterized protein n=1 Tax=Triparma columacea TaxID=722753 RepID=A0A9W7LC46_9STRA|nr:hypothetical protein TrCOL_g3482 [Triparma columacea]
MPSTVSITEPFSCLGWSNIKSRVTNTASARNAERLVNWSRYGLLLNIFFTIWCMVEEYIWRTRADDLVGEKGEWSIDNTFVIIFHFAFPAAFVIFDYSIMSDVTEILENDRTKTAKLFWCCKSRTSLFGWTYMKIKFFLMAASLGFLLFFSTYDQDQIDDLVEEVESLEELTDVNLFLVSVGFYIYVNYVSIACGIFVYLVIYHCLKRIDDDDRRNVFPNHDYSKDAICCTSGCSLKHCAFWTVYSIVFLFMLLQCLIVIGTFGGHTGFCKDEICTDGGWDNCYVESGEVAGCSEEGFSIYVDPDGGSSNGNDPRAGKAAAAHGRAAPTGHHVSVDFVGTGDEVRVKNRLGRGDKELASYYKDFAMLQEVTKAASKTLTGEITIAHTQLKEEISEFSVTSFYKVGLDLDLYKEEDFV